MSESFRTGPPESHERAVANGAGASAAGGLENTAVASDLEVTVRGILAAAPKLRDTSDDAILSAWNDTVARFLDPGSPERRALDPDLLAATGLSAVALDLGLRTICAGMAGEPAARALREAHGQRASRQAEHGFSLVVLARTPPGLLLQSLLPALAVREPVLFKTSRAEPCFAPAFLSALGRRLPVLGDAFATATWTGGDQTIERRLFGTARVVAAYGDETTVGSIKALAPRRLVAFGPGIGLGWVGSDADLLPAARGLATDVVLFDQRGCLSVQAVLADRAVAASFAAMLAEALADLATQLPPGHSTAAELAGVRLAREEAALRGLSCHGDAFDAGTVIVENEPRLRPSPGLRTVRVHPVPPLPALDEWSGRLHGVARAGELPRRMRRALRVAGVSRFAPAGQLQATDALWRNGGIDLAALFATGS